MDSMGQTASRHGAVWFTILLVFELVFGLWALPHPAQAQWTDTGATIYTNDNVGVKTSTVTSGIELDVNGDIATNAGTATAPSYTFRGDTNTGLFNPAADQLGVTTGGVERLRINGSGNVGIGTTTPLTKIDIRGDAVIYGSQNLYFGTSASGSNRSAIRFNQTNNILKLQNDGVSATNAEIQMSASGTAFTIGNVGIGTTTPSTKLHVVGDVTVTGNIAAKYQDLAEWVLAPRPFPAGMVVVLDPEYVNQVIPSSRPYDVRVAGVISDTPGILLGEAGEGKVKVATTGRVKVKVDATRQPIQVGDLLVTGDKPGIAMRSEPLNLGETLIHRPGTLIGKALEPLKEGEGEILVLLSLQ